MSLFVNVLCAFFFRHSSNQGFIQSNEQRKRLRFYESLRRMEIQAENRRRASIIQEEGENGERMPLIPHEQSINGHGFLVCFLTKVTLFLE